MSKYDKLCIVCWTVSAGFAVWDLVVNEHPWSILALFIWIGLIVWKVRSNKTIELDYEIKELENGEWLLKTKRGSIPFKTRSAAYNYMINDVKSTIDRGH